MGKYNMKEYMKYISDDHLEVIFVNENCDDNTILGNGYLPLIGIDDQESYENKEYSAMKLILGSEIIQYTMLPKEHKEVSNGNIRIIPLDQQSILLYEDNQTSPTIKLKNDISWMLDHLSIIEETLQNLEKNGIQKYRFVFGNNN